MMSHQPDKASKVFIEQIVAVSQKQWTDLNYFVSQLIKWQKKTNLIANATVEDIWVRHVADSVQLVKLGTTGSNWIDLGSGGGFPGLVIAILKKDEPEFSITLVESNTKKCAFLRTVARELGLPVEIKPSRIESFAKQYENRKIEGENDPIGGIVLTARALAPLERLFGWSAPILKTGTGLFHKGRLFEQELVEAQMKWDFQCRVHKSALSEDSVILEIKNLFNKSANA